MKKLLSIILSITLMLSFTAFAADDDASVIASDIASLTSDSLLTAPLVDGEYLVDSLKLPTSGAHGSAISWASNNEAVISKAGTVTRPAEQAAEVTLTATVSYGSGEPQTANFSYKVAPLNMYMEGIDDLLTLATYKGSDFTNDNWNDSLVFASAPHAPSVNDGLATAGSETRFYWSGGGRTTPVYVEFVLRRTTEENITIKPFNHIGNVQALTTVTWKADGTVSIGSNTTTSTYPEKLKLGIYLNSGTNTCSIWLDNVLVFSDVEITNYGTGTGFQSMGFTNSTSGALKFEEYRFYNITPIGYETALESVTDDIQALTADSLLTAPLTADGYLLDSLVLPTSGANHTRITWESANPSVISTTGTVSRPVQSVDDVVLTATVTRASASQTKPFTFKVAPLNMPMEGIDDFGTLTVYKGSDFTNTNWKDGAVFPTSDLAVTDGLAATVSSETRFYWNGALKSTVAYIEFVMKKAFGEAITIKPMNNNGNGWSLTTITWKADGTVSGTFGTTTEAYTNNLKLGLYIDAISGKYSLWLNNVIVANGIEMTNRDGTGIQSVNFSATAGTLQFESYAFYNVKYSYRSVHENGAYKATFYAPEIGDTHSAFKCYLALYDGSELVALKPSDVVAGNCDGRSVAQIEFTDDEVAEFDVAQPECKAFIWSVDGLYTPLAKSKSVTK